MSHKSQEKNMRRLAKLFSQDLSYIWGENESGPNGAKKQFLNMGRTFLRALGKDLGLRDAEARSNPGGIAVSGDCSLIGMWENSGIDIYLGQLLSDSDCTDVPHGPAHPGLHRWAQQLSDPGRSAEAVLFRAAGKAGRSAKGGKLL